MTNDTTIKIKYIEAEFSIDDLDSKYWSHSDVTKLNKYWSGKLAPQTKHTAVQLSWSGDFFYIRFIANKSESLNLNKNPDITTKTQKLWERDVCEIFVAPDQNQPEKYCEFEVSPTGEWLDLEIHQMPYLRETNWNFESGMATAARIEPDQIIMAIKIPWSAFGKAPKEGDIWKGNLFRVVGKGENRKYLAWQPTESKVPNFHLPEKFGSFAFIKE